VNREFLRVMVVTGLRVLAKAADKVFAKAAEYERRNRSDEKT
jgi:hypothetical protein